MKRRLYALGLGGLMLASVGCAHHLSSPVSADTPTPAVAAVAGNDITHDVGVVDYKSLMKSHPDYEKLTQVDEQILKLQAQVEKIPLEDVHNQQMAAREKMRKAMEKAKWELEAERSAVEAQMQGLGHSLAAQAQAELQRLQQDAEAKLVPELKEFRQQQQSAPSAAPAPQDVGRQSNSEVVENLKLMRTRNLMARKLELQKSFGNEVQAESQRLEGVLATYVDGVAAKYQDEKINLQLKHSISQDEAEKQKIEERLSVIADEVDAAKTSKRNEIQAELQKFRDQKNAECERQLSSYQGKLDAEIAQKAPSLLSHSDAPRPMASRTAPVMTAELKKKIADMRSRIEGEMAAKKAEINARMQQESAVARGRLEAKQAEIKSRIQKVSDDLMAELQNRSKYLSKETKAKLEAAKARLAKAEGERKQLIDQMDGDVKKLVGEVAEKKHVAMVIGQAIYQSEELTDLTDLSMVAVKQIKR